MSTRATYRFIPNDRRFRPAVTIYIHHDGYPEGAAGYLQDAYNAETFIRKNNRAEITASHEVHGDTEYQYDIHQKTGIRAFERRGYGEDVVWNKFFDGPVEDFVETYQNTPIAKAINSKAKSR